MIKPWFWIVVLAGFLAVAASPAAAGSERDAAAEAAARNWLALVDQGDYGASWQGAAAYFKTAVNQDRWQQALNGVRKPLGKLLSRTLKSRTFHKELPGAPDGDYVVIQFTTRFENKTNAVETVTPMLDGGTWRVAGYFIK